MSRLRTVSMIVRHPDDPSKATITLSCGHIEEIDGFPLGNPPPCFRRECPDPHCADTGRHGRESIKQSHRAEGRNWVD